MTALSDTFFPAAVLSYPVDKPLVNRYFQRSAILIKVLITDDRITSRKGLRALMLTQPEIQIIGEANNGEKAIQLIEKQKPDVVLMDAFMPKLNGLQATRIIKRRWNRIRVVMLTMHGDLREEALAAGADAFLVKGCSPEELIKEIKNERRK